MKTTGIMRAAAALALSGAAVATLSACAPNQEQPLIFVSRDKFGLSIDTQPAPTGEVGVTIGYESDDFSLVPISVVTTSGESLHPIRGCYSAARGGGDASCDIKLVNVQPTVQGGDLVPQALPQPSAGAGGTNGGAKEKQAMHDSLSVFSSFNADGGVKDKGDVTFGLGKLFATGVAAQQLTEGQNYYLQSKGKAEYAAAVSVCLTALKAAAGGTLTADQMQVCTGEPAAVAVTQPATQ